MSAAEEPRSETENATRCAWCARMISTSGPKVVSVLVGRSEHLDWDEERLFRETQEFAFCDLAHANEYLAKTPIADTWEDTAIDDTEVGWLGQVGCWLIGFFLLAALITGVIVGGQWLWGVAL